MTNSPLLFARAKAPTPCTRSVLDGCCAITVQAQITGIGFLSFLQITAYSYLAEISDAVGVAQRHGDLTPHAT